MSHIFVGYSTTSKTYRLYDMTNRKYVISRDVVFFEDKLGIDGIVNEEAPDNFYIPVSRNRNEVEDMELNSEKIDIPVVTITTDDESRS